MGPEVVGDVAFKVPRLPPHARPPLDWSDQVPLAGFVVDEVFPFFAIDRMRGDRRVYGRSPRHRIVIIFGGVDFVSRFWGGDQKSSSSDTSTAWWYPIQYPIIVNPTITKIIPIV
jgi:hypothetical protein